MPHEINPDVVPRGSKLLFAIYIYPSTEEVEYKWSEGTLNYIKSKGSFLGLIRVFTFALNYLIERELK